MRVLIVKLHAIGDVTMCLPMVTALRKRDPSVQISWLCGKPLAPLIGLMEDIDVIPVDDAKLLNGSIFEKCIELSKLWRKLFGRYFDLIICGYLDSRARLLTLTAISKERRSCARQKGGWWAVAGRYQGDEYLRLVTKLDGPEMEPAELPTFRIPLSDRIRGLLGDTRKPLIAVAPGGAKNTRVESPLRRWPLSSYRSLAESLLPKGYSVVVTGGPADDWVSEGFRGLEVTDLVGQTSLTDLIALYGVSAGVVTHDSGPLHLALLARTPTVALFGPTIPQEKVLPYKWVRILWGGENLACRPCYDGKTYAPCTDNQCMRQISVGQVVDALENVIISFRRTIPIRNGLARDVS
jgi:heptosyltransferase II